MSLEWLTRCKNGGQGRNRTADASLFRAALYQLSYLARIGLRTQAFGGTEAKLVRNECHYNNPSQITQILEAVPVAASNSLLPDFGTEFLSASFLRQCTTNMRQKT